MARKMIDCRKQTDIDCKLTISGAEDEVLRAATEHAIAVHGMKDTPELRQMLRSDLEDEHLPAGELGRKVADCRSSPSERNCSLRVSGRPGEVLDTVVAHVVSEHGHAYSSDLRTTIGSELVDEVFAPAPRASELPAPAPA